MRYRATQNAIFVLLLVGTTIVFFWVVWEFLLPVFWAAVVAILFHRMHRWWLARLKERHSLAAFSSVLTVVVVGLLPITFVAVAVAREALAVYAEVSAGRLDQLSLLAWLEQQTPWVNDLVGDYGIDLGELRAKLSQAVVTVSRSLAMVALDMGRNLARMVGLTFVMLYVAFFFFRDGPQILDRIERAIPLGKGREEELVTRFAVVVRGTVKGTLVIGLVQGIMGGLTFWVLGIDAPVLWGAIMVVLSILPAVGSALVWLPAAIILIAGGSWIRGVILIAIGSLAIGLIDNFLRPILVGRDTKMPDYLILITTLGGLSLFGIAGFVLGPVVAALFMVLWEMLEKELGQTEAGATGVGAEGEEPVGPAAPQS